MGQGLRWKPRAPILVFMFRYLSVREAVPTHALSLEPLARTELVSLGGPWVRGMIFRAKRMFYVAFGVLRVGWKDGTRQQGWAGGGGGGGMEALGSVFQLIAFLLALSFITSQSGLHGMGGFPALHCHGLSWVCEARTLPAGTNAEFSEPIFQSNY